MWVGIVVVVLTATILLTKLWRDTYWQGVLAEMKAKADQTSSVPATPGPTTVTPNPSKPVIITKTDPHQQRMIDSLLSAGKRSDSAQAAFKDSLLRDRMQVRKFERGFQVTARVKGYDKDTNVVRMMPICGIVVSHYEIGRAHV